jgi:hypothetical protein
MAKINKTTEKKAPEAAGTGLAKLAGKERLVGKVCITGADGITYEYANEIVAFGAWKDRIDMLTWRRGAFFEGKREPAAVPVTLPKPTTATTEPAKPTPSKFKR